MTKEIKEKKLTTISYRPPSEFIDKIKDECVVEGFTCGASFIHSLVVRHFRLKKQAEALLKP
jgi:hypothetical protein